MERKKRSVVMRHYRHLVSSKRMPLPSFFKRVRSSASTRVLYSERKKRQHVLPRCNSFPLSRMVDCGSERIGATYLDSPLQSFSRCGNEARMTRNTFLLSETPRGRLERGWSS